MVWLRGERSKDLAQNTVGGDGADLGQAAVHGDGTVVPHDEIMSVGYVVGEVDVVLANGGAEESLEASATKDFLAN